MKKISITLSILLTVTIFVGCSDDIRRTPGRVYMPDMAYSRAYETYSVTEEMKDSLHKHGINFSNTPVAGTIKRNELLPFLVTRDNIGDTTNYVGSKSIQNPIPVLDSMQSIEAGRLYLVNCGICHGPAMDGNGPLYKGGDGPFPAKPAQLVGDKKYEAMPEGQMFYSVTYGKNKMGSYASQLNTMQRWMVISYIKSRQQAAIKSAAPTGAATSGGADSTAAKK